MASHKGSRDGRVETLCWCGRAIKRIDAQLVRDGRTWSCGILCIEAKALTQQLGTKAGRPPGSRDKHPRKRASRAPHKPIVVVEGGCRYTYVDDGTGHYSLSPTA